MRDADDDAPEFAGEFEDQLASSESGQLRQGDILELIPTEASDEWEHHFGVIITANCDLAFGKHFGRLTYVPIVPVECYVHRLLLPRILEGQLKNLTRRTVENVGSKHSPIMASRIVDMIDAGHYSLHDLQCAVPGDDRSAQSARQDIAKIVALGDALNNLETTADAKAAMRVLRDLCVSLSTHSADGADTILGRYRGDLKSRLTKSSPGDIMFLSKLSSYHTLGYVAILRMIREIRDTHVALSAIEERTSLISFSARRIARLSTLYIHRLVQQMSHVFTDIGLPVSYEESRESVISKWLDALSGSSAQ